MSRREGRTPRAAGRTPGACGHRCARGSDRAAPSPRPASLAPRRGLTLVELLIAIAIIAILATLLVGVGAAAAEAGREARSKALVARLHTLVMERYDAYRTRRPSGAPDVRLTDVNNPANVGAVRAAQRLHVVRTLMRMEMPDRWSDILNNTVASRLPAVEAADAPENRAQFTVPVVNASNPVSQAVVLPRSPLCEAYLRRYANITSGDVAVIERNQSAECLYLIVMLSTGDGEATSLFKESEIGDTDGDGAPEFLDGWGNPIAFVRWPKGHDGESDLQTTDTDPPDPLAPAWQADHDPIDAFRLHAPEFARPQETANLATRLVPLVFSAGPDGEYGVVGAERSGDDPLVVQRQNSPYGRVLLGFPSANAAIDTQWVIDPYASIGEGTNSSGATGQLRLGQVWGPVDEVLRPAAAAGDAEPWVDNLTNHQLGGLSTRGG